MAPTLPELNRAVLLQKQSDRIEDAIESLTIVDRPLRPPRPGEVVVRMEAAPCNPSDLSFLQGTYGLHKTLPTVPGFEGSGTVIASGGGMMGQFLVGKRVACAVQSDSDGTWAQHCVANATMCVPLRKNVDFEQAAMLLVNPLTALALLEQSTHEGHRAAVNTAAASQLGQMLIRLARERRYPLINLVRRPQQLDQLHKEGAQLVLDTSQLDFSEKFAAEAKRLNATLLIDCLGGAMTGRLLKLMPDGAKAKVVGALSQERCGEIDPVDLIFHGKTVEGFWLAPWLQKKNLLDRLAATLRVQKLVAAKVFHSQVRARLPLGDVRQGLHDYCRSMSDGKVLICPNR